MESFKLYTTKGRRQEFIELCAREKYNDLFNSILRKQDLDHDKIGMLDIDKNVYILRHRLIGYKKIKLFNKTIYKKSKTIGEIYENEAYQKIEFCYFDKSFKHNLQRVKSQLEEILSPPFTIDIELFSESRNL